MPETLVIRLPEDPDAAWEWVVVSAEGTPVTEVSSGLLVEAGSLSENRRVLAFAPATTVLRTTAEIPLKNQSRIRQALPYALEEQLAGNVETQHFACGKRGPNGRIPVAVVAKTLLEEWLGNLEQAGLKPDGIFAESDGLAPVPATVSVLIDQQRVVICDPDGNITVADPDSLQAILELQLDLYGAQGANDNPEDEDADEADDDRDATPVNLLVYCRTEEHEQHAVLWEMLRVRTDSLEIKLLPDGSLARLASQLVSGGGVNLLQGPYTPKSEMPLQWKEWRLAAALVAGLTLLLVVHEGAQYWQLSRQEIALDDAATQVLRATFGDEGEIDDPWAQLRSRLGQSDAVAAVSGPGFEDAIETLSIAFAETPGIRIEAMSYRSGNLDLQLLAPDVESLDQLRQRIVAPGRFFAEIQSANPDDENIKGRMKISAAEGA